jgi:hypothetical protein
VHEAINQVPDVQRGVTVASRVWQPGRETRSGDKGDWGRQGEPCFGGLPQYDSYWAGETWRPNRPTPVQKSEGRCKGGIVFLESMF